MNLPRFLVGLLLVPALLTTGCQESPKEIASQTDTGLPTETVSLAATGASLPSVAIVSPENFSYFKTKEPDPLHPNAADNPNHPLVSVTVQFSVANYVYPALNKGVMFILDEAWDPDPTAPNQPLAIVTSAADVPVVLGSIPPGQHTLTACLIQKVQNTYNGQAGLYWDYIDADPSATAPGVQRACSSITLKVSIVGCYPTIYDPAQGGYICDPANPGTCCVDQNPCSVDNCQWITSGGVNQYECRYGPVAGSCCQSDLECPGEACDPDTHLCTGGTPDGEPEAVEPAPELVPEVVEPPPEPAPEVVEPAPEPIAEPAVESLVEAAPEPLPEPAAEVTEPAADVSAAEPGADVPAPDVPTTDNAAADSGAGDTGNGSGSGGGSCSWPATPPASAPLSLLLVLTALRIRRRA